MIIKAFKGIRPNIDNGTQPNPALSVLADMGKLEAQTTKGHIFVQEQQECLYVYRMISADHCQTGIMCCSAVEEYKNDTIKRHELTQHDRVDYLKELLTKSGLNKGPVLFSYPAMSQINDIIAAQTSRAPEHEFYSVDSVRHMLWVIRESAAIERLVQLFSQVPDCYIIDGHHRSEAASRVASGAEMLNPQHSGHEGYNFFLSAYFPDDQLKLHSFHRLVKSLGGLSSTAFLARLSKDFEVSTCEFALLPERSNQLGMYLDKQWYCLQVKPESYNQQCPAQSLGPAVVAELILKNILAIDAEANNGQVEYLEENDNLDELTEQVDRQQAAVAFTLCPVSMEQFRDVVRAGKVMPPKSTFFAPKPKPGLLFNRIYE